MLQCSILFTSLGLQSSCIFYQRARCFRLYIKDGSIKHGITYLSLESICWCINILMRQKWCTSQTSVVVLFCFLIICFWAKRRNLWRPTHLWNQFQVATPGTAAFGTSAVTLGWSYNLTCSSEGRQFYLIIQSQSALFNNLCKKLALLKPSSGTPVHFADVWQWEDSSNFWRFLLFFKLYKQKKELSY